MKIIFHGAAKEVGRSCVEIIGDDNKRIILDAGIKVHEHGIFHPEGLTDLKNISAVFISHSHLDHIGSLPLLIHQGLNCPIFSTLITKGISKILLDDSLHIEMLRHKVPAYSSVDVSTVMNKMKPVSFNQTGEFNGIKYTFYPAGHIPGSSSILIEMSGKRILYTGDFNTQSTHLLSGAYTDYKNIDVMIIESTYGNRDHPSRILEEKKFIGSVKKALDINGSVLVPVFSLGRAQEISIILSKYDFNVPMYLDGMARKVTSLLLSNWTKFDSVKELKFAMSKIKSVRDRNHRDSILYSKAIFLSTAGMLDGGPVLDYLKHMWQNPNNALLMTGFQAPGTNGKMLLESERAFVDGMQIHFDGMIKKYDFSAHSGRKELQNFIKKVSPKVLFVNHGDEEAMTELESFAKTVCKTVYVPDICQIIKI